MLMGDNKKKMATIIVSKLGKKEESEAPAPQKGGVEQDDSVGMEACAEELLSAIESKSPKGIAAALKSAWEMMEAQEDEGEDEPKQEGEEY